MKASTVPTAAMSSWVRRPTWRSQAALLGPIAHADQLPVQRQRHHQFGVGRRIAGDVAREAVHVGDALGLAAGSRGAAHALVERDADAGRQALERADHQLAAVVEVEPDPVEVRQGVVDQRRQIGGVGDAVAFALDQGARLGQEQVVLFRLAAGQGVGGEHIASVAAARRGITMAGLRPWERR
jgi:hypothetical protein